MLASSGSVNYGAYRPAQHELDSEIRARRFAGLAAIPQLRIDQAPHRLRTRAKQDACLIQPQVASQSSTKLSAYCSLRREMGMVRLDFDTARRDQL